MRILLTGACGRLAPVVMRTLSQAGHQLVGLDVVYRRDVPCDLRICDLMNPSELYPHLKDIDVVVHLANWASYMDPNLIRVIGQLVPMHTNVFKAAADLGVKKIIFASSVNVFSGATRPDWGMPPVYLPLDGDLPINAGNAYGLSKALGEQLLAHVAHTTGIQAIALRMPWLADAYALEHHIRPKAIFRQPNLREIAEGLTYLSQSDVAQLIACIIQADLPGYRCYFPASQHNKTSLSLSEVIAKFYQGVALKRPLEQITSLVDISRITAETGWTPLD